MDYCPLDYRWCGGDCSDCTGPPDDMAAKYKANVACAGCGWRGKRVLRLRKRPLKMIRLVYGDAKVSHKCPRCGRTVRVQSPASITRAKA